MNFNIKIVFGDFGLNTVQSIPNLTEEQIKSLNTIPPYYYNLEISGYIEEDNFMVKNVITNNHDNILPISHKEFEELLYESDRLMLNWIINNIKK